MRLIQKDEGIGCSWKAIIKRSKDSSIEQFQWATVWAGPEHIYFGHDAKSNLQVSQRIVQDEKSVSNESR
jgi:hypothetical protein